MIFTIIAIIGALYVSHNKPLIANYFWVLSNAGFIIHNILINEYEMLILFIAYEIIAIYGIYYIQFRGKNEKYYDLNLIFEYEEYAKKYKKYGIERKVVGHISEKE